jgi:hypothetical protein
MHAMTPSLPQGTLDLDTAIERLARHRYPRVFIVERGEQEEALRELCQLIVVEKNICPRILNESGSQSYEADRAQFVALQERYIFVTQRPLRGFTEKEQRFLEIERPQTSEWRDVHGQIHLRSRLIFLESDLEVALGGGRRDAEAPARARLGVNEQKHAGVLQAIATLGLENCRTMNQEKVLAPKIIGMVKKNCGLQVSPRYALGLYRKTRRNDI